MPDVRNCKRCGKIYTYIGGPPICQPCKDLDEISFRQVKEYLYKNPGALLSEVSNALEISVEKIRGYLKEGRLEIIGSECNIFLECENCGKSIRSGRYCDECSREVEKGMKATASQMSSSMSAAKEDATKAAGMRYLSKDTKK